MSEAKPSLVEPSPKPIFGELGDRLRALADEADRGDIVGIALVFQNGEGQIGTTWKNPGGRWEALIGGATILAARMTRISLKGCDED